MNTATGTEDNADREARGKKVREFCATAIGVAIGYVVSRFMGL